MSAWLIVLFVILLALLAGFVTLLLWIRRHAANRDEASELLRQYGMDIVRLPGRLRRVAADRRTPRRARWMLIGLAAYIASPIDLIPDFLPVIGQLDDLIIVSLVLRYVRQIIPPEVWDEQFPRRNGPNSPT